MRHSAISVFTFALAILCVRAGDSDRHAGIGGSMFVLSAGQAQTANIVFVCDASGSMLNTFVTLRRQLSMAVSGLEPTQSFNLIFMRAEGCNAMAEHLLTATPNNKKAFLDAKVTPTGETNPIPALEAAFAQKPQVIFLITDGDFPDNAAVPKRILELNGKRQVRVNTIAFVNDADTDVDFIRVLKEIAGANGGNYRHVNEKDVNR